MTMAEPAGHRKALALISGGLDSQLAAKIVGGEGVEVIGATVNTGFNEEGSEEIFERIREDLGVEIRHLSLKEDDYLKIIKSPEHGYGSAMNPCLDCRILVLKEAKEYMERISADFAVTGEVVGQRPMSQRRETLELVRKESSLGDRLLRPLSAKLLPPTLPEKEGWVDRDELLDIQGRSRERQLELADQWGLEHYTQPAGGCLLTEEEFGHRIQEVFGHRGKEETRMRQLKVLKFGRHFRLPEGAKAIIGRDEEENEKLKKFLPHYWSIRVANFPGPLTLISEGATEEEVILASRLTGRYSQGRNQERLAAIVKQGGETRTYRVEPLDRDSDLIRELRIESSNRGGNS